MDGRVWVPEAPGPLLQRSWGGWRVHWAGGGLLGPKRRVVGGRLRQPPQTPSYSVHALWKLPWVLKWVLSHFSCVIPWTVAHQAPLPMGFSRQEWSNPRLLCLLHWQVVFFFLFFLFFFLTTSATLEGGPKSKIRFSGGGPQELVSHPTQSRLRCLCPEGWRWAGP